ncbi:MAG: 8-amino-7-oxononanoate synthase [Salinivirgaceae bacterium]|nr:8-amino-7-oxononanoate synthase [Salinivirgaceae bacterium]
MKHKKYTRELILLEESGNFRKFPEQASDSMIDLSSNDYLGLMQNASLQNEFMQSVDLSKLKFTASSSRLLSGNSNEYTQLENLIASQYQRDACLVFNSGYHANTGIIPALAQKNDLIIADKLVHASIIDGMQLSKADFLRYNHLDYDHLELLLEKKSKHYEHVFIISESVFSMDGDKANIQKLVELKNKFGAFLYIDEAHAVGALGKNGLGCVEEENLIREVDFIMGTFGKALASVGAYLVCDSIFKHYLINKARTLIFTSALPPINLAWSHFIMQKLPDFHENRIQLKKLGQQFAELLNVKSDSHIVPYIIGENKNAIQASQLLKENGFNVLPIRYPTVPQGRARLRFSLNASMKIGQLELIGKVLTSNLAI